MLAGQTCVYNGYEVCLFPLDYLYCTQKYGAGTYSHCCTKATDWIGTTTHYPVYAPFSCHRIWNDYGSGYGDCAFQSDNKVWTPQGLEYVTLVLTHDDNPDFSKNSFSQGELIARTGTTPIGLVTGDHIHIEASNIQGARLVDSGYSCQAGGSNCYYLNGVQKPEDIFYLTGDEQIISTQGLNFETWQGSPIGSSGFKWWFCRYQLQKKKGLI